MTPGQALSRRHLLKLALALPLLAACGGGESHAPPTKRVYFEIPTATPGTPAPAATSTPQPSGTRAASYASPTPVSERAPLPGEAPPDARPTATPLVIPTIDPARRGTPVAVRRPAPVTLNIPAIKLDARIVRIGTKLDPQGNLIWETAAFAVGHHDTSVNPGEPGNVVLSGHISSRTEGRVFKDLPKVKAGDGIILRTPERDHLYAVDSIRVVLPTEIDILQPTGESRATLITCVPDGVYTHRLIVSALHV